MKTVCLTSYIIKITNVRYKVQHFHNYVLYFKGKLVFKHTNYMDLHRSCGGWVYSFETQPTGNVGPLPPRGWSLLGHGCNGGINLVRELCIFEEHELKETKTVEKLKEQKWIK